MEREVDTDVFGNTNWDKMLEKSNDHAIKSIRAETKKMASAIFLVTELSEEEYDRYMCEDVDGVEVWEPFEHWSHDNIADVMDDTQRFLESRIKELCKEVYVAKA